MSADGTWNVTMKGPMGERAATLKLATDGDVLSGTLESPEGNQEVSEGKVDGNDLTWTINMTQPMQMKLGFTGTVDGDKISGKVSLGSFGEATFEGTRA